MNLAEFLKVANADMISPVGLSFGMRSSSIDVFILEVIGDEDSPIRFNGRMIAFDDAVSCRAALEKLAPLLPAQVKASHEYDFVCDIPGALKLVTGGSVDSDAIVLNCINTLLDFVSSSPFELPSDYAVLKTLADDLTFREVLELTNEYRFRLRDALLWCAGITIVDLRVIRSTAEFESLLPMLSVTTKRFQGDGTSFNVSGRPHI